MRSFRLAALAATLLALGGFGAAQQNVSGPGSLLLYSEFDNRAGVATIYSITNTNSDMTQVGQLFAGTVDVEFVYRGRVAHGGALLDCLEFNRVARLTPNDTLTLLTFVHNPNQQQGYCYAFAKSPVTGAAIKFDWLIGQTLVIDGPGQFEYSLAPATFRAGEALAAGAPTDLDGDGVRDLDGLEYEQVVDEVLIPRFFGQGRSYSSELVLVNLTGGPSFEAILDLLIYNDNEEVFSGQYGFRCWKKAPLLQISGVFLNDFLLTTNHATNEIQGLPSVKTGWIRLDGNLAYSSATSIADPAFLAVLVERIGPYKAADLPYGRGRQANGDLLPLGPFGDQ
jgi:hypothetical protein